MSHSKRNTSRAVFTSHERALAKAQWATSSARLSRDSFLPFGSCGLCLGSAREPVACSRGDVFCRECALANILAQKQELRRAARNRREADLEADHARARADDEGRARAVRDFELTQVGLGPARSHARRRQRSPSPTIPADDASGAVAASRAPPSAASEETSTAPASGESSTALVVAGSKRKFALDEDEVSRIAREDRNKARKGIEEEKTLVTIHFHQDTGSNSQTKRSSCPACLKALTNASKPVMSEQCGHVLCMACVKLLMSPPEPEKTAGDDSKGPSEALQPPVACPVCDTPVARAKANKGNARKKGGLPPGLVALRWEGTGFSARGTNTVEKASIAFQC